MDIYATPDIVRHCQLLLDSYYTCTGKQLISRATPKEDAQQLKDIDFVVVSHGTQIDPIFNYANQPALDLWEMNWSTFTSLPSRYSAEPIRRDLREKMLEEAKEKGYFDGYEGVRISSSGKRFMIKNALIWNLVDENGQPYGQAATFSEIEYL